jgi:hypothetical protein
VKVFKLLFCMPILNLRASSLLSLVLLYEFRVSSSLESFLSARFTGDLEAPDGSGGFIFYLPDKLDPLPPSIADPTDS